MRKTRLEVTRRIS